MSYSRYGPLTEGDTGVEDRAGGALDTGLQYPDGYQRSHDTKRPKTRKRVR